MKKSTLLLLALIFLLVACAPSESVIQAAIEKTKAVWTPIPTLTSYPTYTQYPTYTEHPTITPTPTPAVQTYDLQTGFCMQKVGAFNDDIDPKTLKFCVDMTTEPVILGPGEKVERIYDTSWSTTEPLESFCALYLLDGTFVMSYVDTTGSGKVYCGPNN